MQATSYHNINILKLQTSLNPEWKIEHEFISKSSRDAFHGFCTLCISMKCVFIYFSHSLFVYLCISITSRSPEIMFSGTVPDYLFIYVFILLPEVQKCYVFWHCARLFVYLFIVLSEVQKCYVFRQCALCKTGSS